MPAEPVGTDPMAGMSNADKREIFLSTLAEQNLQVSDEDRLVTAARTLCEALAEQEWIDALRAELPSDVFARVVVPAPDDRHHSAWRALHRNAADEVARGRCGPALLLANLPAVIGVLRGSVNA